MEKLMEKFDKGGEETRPLIFFEKSGKNNCRQTGEIIVANHSTATPA